MADTILNDLTIKPEHWTDQIPENSMTIVIKAGTHKFIRNVKLGNTQEDTAKYVYAVCQMAMDTVDTLGIKSGGIKKDKE